MKALATRHSRNPLTPRELHSLRQIRLHQGWSFTRMAELIGNMSGPTLFRILDEQHRGNEISVFRIRRFLQGNRDDAGR